MSQPLPIGEYQWVDEKELQLFANVEAILNLSDHSRNGYIFDVDLHYPKKIHDAQHTMISRFGQRNDRFRMKQSILWLSEVMRRGIKSINYCSHCMIRTIM